jgi:hypothetical protein
MKIEVSDSTFFILFRDAQSLNDAATSRYDTFTIATQQMMRQVRLQD